MSTTHSMEFLYQEHVQNLLKNYSEVLERLQVSGLLIHSGMNRSWFLDDQGHPFRVNPHFSYWVPLLEHPHCFLWLAANERPVLFYYKKTDFWHKMAPDPTGMWTPHFDIRIISDQEEVRHALGSKLQKTIYIGEWHDHFSHWNMRDSNRADLLNEFHFLRTTKTPYEVFCLRRANLLGAIGHMAAQEAFYSGCSEFEIQMEYVRSLRVHEFDHPYRPIVALNENGGVLHYHDGEIDRLEKGQIYSLLIDAGCGFQGYASDITRTYAFSDGEFKDLIEAMDKAQLKIIQELKLGTLYTDNHQRTHKEIAQILHDFDFCRMSVTEMVEKKVTHTFFPHGTGHFLGLQVHDVAGFVKDAKGDKNKPPADHPYFKKTCEIQLDHVFTIEPGLYFIPSLLKQLQKSEVSSKVNWDKIAQFMKYGGIRIEDNIYVGEKGVENLTRSAFQKAKNLGL